MVYKESENKRKQNYKKIPGSCLRAEKSMEYESDCDTNFHWSTWSWKKVASLSRRQQCQSQLIDLKKDWNLEETCCHLVFSEKPSLKTCVKNSQCVKKKMILTVYFKLNLNLPTQLPLTFVMNKIKTSGYGIIFTSEINANPNRNLHIYVINETISEKFSNIKQQTWIVDWSFPFFKILRIFLLTLLINHIFTFILLSNHIQNLPQKVTFNLC